MSEIKIYHKTHKGFDITFDNGITASVQFGEMSSCSPCVVNDGYIKARNAECAAIFDGEFVTDLVAPEMLMFEDSIIGHAKPDEIADFIFKCKNFKKKE